MKSKKRLLKNSLLYAIIDKNVLGKRSIHNVVNKIKDSGVDIIQLRDKQFKREVILKDAFQLRKLLIGSKIIFIINDYLDIAKIVDTDGVHLGQDDISVKLARQILGQDKIIGVSCHSLIEALRAQSEGADYISIGPIFKSSTKPEYKPIGLNLIKEIKAKIKIPFFAIGGINLKNINQLFSIGIKRIAVCRAYLKTRSLQRSLVQF